MTRWSPKELREHAAGEWGVIAEMLRQAAADAEALALIADLSDYEASDGSAQAIAEKALEDSP